MAGDFVDLNFTAPFLVREQGTTSLHFTMGETQSSMRLDSPDDLHIDYTRTMMGFLLLNPRPRSIFMIGLGGGSHAKFCHRYLPHVRMTVVENNPGVIALRKDFNIPDDDDRLTVVVDDAAAFLRSTEVTTDVLLVDGFDQTGQPAQLCSQAFYDDCFQALAPGGVMVANLHADHADVYLFVERIAESFEGNAMQVLAEEKGNCVVFAGRERPVTLKSLRNPEWGAALDPRARRQLRSEFTRIGWSASSAIKPPGSGPAGG